MLAAVPGPEGNFCLLGKIKYWNTKLAGFFSPFAAASSIQGCVVPCSKVFHPSLSFFHYLLQWYFLLSLLYSATRSLRSAKARKLRSSLRALTSSSQFICQKHKFGDSLFKSHESNQKTTFAAAPILMRDKFRFGISSERNSFRFI